MANVLNFIKPSAKLPRNGFDLSQRHVFSCKAGQLLPVLSLECVPGDHHEINVLEMARMVNIHTDAFARVKQNFEFYFVPYSQLFSGFNDVILEKHQPFSSLMESADPVAEPRNAVPYINVEQLLTSLLELRESYDMHGFDSYENALRLLDLLGYGFFRNIANQDAIHNYQGYRVNPFRIAAYQKIYADYYRSPFYEEQDYSGSGLDFVFNYNFDDSDGNVDLIDHPLDGLLAMRYRLWKRDLFTGLIPSPQFGGVSMVDLKDIELKITNAPTSSSQRNLVNPANSNNVSLNAAVTPLQFNAANAFSVYDLFKAEALQKWRENAGRAGLHLSDNYRAHYGVDSRYLSDHMCQYVGSFDSSMLIDEVMSNAATSDASLGEVGGKGIGTASGHIKFDCKDFGVLMCIYSVIPSAEFNAIGIDKANTLIEPSDFWRPEFDNIGFEPVVGAQFNFSEYRAADSGNVNGFNHIIGYGPRNMHLKTAIDKVHGEFINAVDHDGTPLNGLTGGVFDHWTIPRRYISSFINYLNQYHVSPRDLDTIFVQAATSDQSSDQFIVNCNFDIKSIRNMSVLGLPNF